MHVHMHNVHLLEMSIKQFLVSGFVHEHTTGKHDVYPQRSLLKAGRIICSYVAAPDYYESLVPDM